VMDLTSRSKSLAREIILGAVADFDDLISSSSER